MVKIKAIETHYKGYKFRSRLEARWGVAFDAAGIDWIYEHEGFELPSGWYLPDFYLPQVNMWAEVKPTDFSEDEKIKCAQLALLSGEPCLMLNGVPSLENYWALNPKGMRGFSPDCQAFHGCYYEDHLLFESHNYPRKEKRFYICTGLHYPDKQVFACMQNFTPIESALSHNFDRKLKSGGAQ